MTVRDITAYLDYIASHHTHGLKYSFFGCQRSKYVLISAKSQFLCHMSNLLGIRMIVGLIYDPWGHSDIREVMSGIYLYDSMEYTCIKVCVVKLDCLDIDDEIVKL